MARRPLIGITSYAREELEVPTFQLPCGYVDSIRSAGGVPVVLPPGPGEVGELLDSLDGLILAGGGDISPAAYGGLPHETIYSVCEERDEFEFALARAALQRLDLPILCICRGLQVLNVILGGTLYAHLPEALGERVAHRRLPRLTQTHHVRVDPASRLAGMLGTTEPQVCSWHHQGIDRLGRNLRPVAWSDDDLVEAVEETTHPWCIGVQWHPEMQPHDGAQQHLFHAFLDACRSRDGRQDRVMVSAT